MRGYLSHGGLKPPSTTICCAVTYDAASDARKMAAPARSLGFPHLRSGTLLFMSATKLDAVAAWIDHCRRSGAHGVIACSALKRRYRNILIGDRADVRLVYLKGDEELIARRFATRHEHFMPRSLLHSQFEALEEPAPDENPIIELDRADAARDRGANFVSAEHGQRRAAARAGISEIIWPWRVNPQGLLMPAGNLCGAGGINL